MQYTYDLIIGPIEMIVDLVFKFFTEEIAEGGIAIIGVSLVINFLTLPLYNKADKIQQKERDLQLKLEPRVKKIKSAFKGDEQFLILSEYYRQNNYHPLYSLRNALSIIIQIPFFMAAYNYLSNCDALKDVSFLFLKNLGEPDALFSISVGRKLFVVNILPIIMTLINVISGIIYSKGFPLKEKIQIYGLAAIFLVILYNSPSGLVFYWILNNLFSLGKNIVLKMKNPKKVVHIGFSVAFSALALFMWIIRPNASIIKKLLLSFIAIFVILLPKLFVIAKKVVSTFSKTNSFENDTTNKKEYFLLMLFSGLVIAITIGFVVPSSIIATSPMEFSYLGTTDNPNTYIFHSLFLMLGLCVFYPLVFYKMFNLNPKILGYSLFTLAICAITNIYFFKHDYGTFNTQFILDNESVLETTSIINTIFPLVLLVILCILLFIVERKKHSLVKYLSIFLVALMMGEIGLSAYKISLINKEFDKYTELRLNFEKESSDKYVALQKKISLSKTEKNVVVIFVDRAISEFFPYALEEFPELKEIYKGFTFYPNSLSFGGYTYAGAPAMLGGYDYTPAKMNERADALLVDKHNEALMLMPKLFLDQNYDVVVIDTPWTNYSWIPDFTPFNQFPEIKTFHLQGQYVDKYLEKIQSNKIDSIKIASDDVCNKQILYFSIMQSLFPNFRDYFYFSTKFRGNFNNWTSFTDYFSALYLLPDFTDFSNTKPTYTFIGNDTPHDWVFLNVPNYTEQCDEKIPIINSSYKYIDDEQLKMYQVNIATFKAIGNWLDTLHQNDCYDNTRIVIVSDHGAGDLQLNSFDKELLGSKSVFNCLFMYKDFDSNSDVKIDNKLMTNADTLFYATKDLDISSNNPFTNQILNLRRENESIIELATEGKTSNNALKAKEKKQFNLNGPTYIIKDNIFKSENWTIKEEN